MILMDDEQENYKLKIFSYYHKNCQRIHPKFRSKIWKEKEVHKLPRFKMEIYDRIKDNEMKRDYIKLIVILNYGGIYVSNNFVCLKNFS